MRKVAYLLLPVLLTVLILGPIPVKAYNQGPDDGHALILRQAIQILWNDGYHEIATTANATANLEALLEGIRQVDDEYGRILLEIAGFDAADWNTAGNTHYYNPGAHPAQSGLKIGLLHGPDTTIYLGYLGLINIRTSLVPGDGDSNRVFALRGPQPSADRLSDWYYAMAVKAMREGNTHDAYLNLGKAIHMVQDLTVPHHAADSYGVADLHQAYENTADSVMERRRYIATTAYPGDPSRTTYFPDILASDFARGAARNSRGGLDEITRWWGWAHDRESAYGDVYSVLLPLAQQLTAGLLYKFHQNWQTEPYSAIKLTVHRAAALDSPDDIGDAELFVSLTMVDPSKPDWRYEDFITGYFGDEDEVRPGAYLGYDVWTFPYTSEVIKNSEVVEMILGLWDDDDIDAWTTSVSGWPSSLYRPHSLDIDPNDNRRLHLQANLRTGDLRRWTGSEWVNIGRLGERITSIGTDRSRSLSRGGRGGIEFTVDYCYVPARDPVPQPPQRPRNIFPGTIEGMVTGVTLTPILYATSYVDPDLSPQMNSEWKIMDGSDAVVFHTYGGPRTLQEVISPLSPGILYKWQVRYQDSTGLWSDWSRATLFITDRPPQRPVNHSPANEATGEPVRPLLTASDYSDPERHAHTASEWEIDWPGEVLGRPQLLNVYRQVSEGTTSHRVRTDLDGNTRYFWRVRYQDALGAWSEWSERTSFTTGLAISLVPPVVIPAPTLRITAPNGGETFTIGADTGINWGTTGTGMVTVDIDYSINGGINWISIARNVTNVGAYTWIIPDTPSTTCRVKVTGRNQDGQIVSADESDRNFVIVAPVIERKVTVSSPKAGETWLAGTARTISWHTTGESIAYVNIYYSTDAGKSFYTVAEKEANDGIYSWIVPDTPSSAVLVRVFALGAKGENLAHGESGIFTISPASKPTTPTPVTVSVTSPKEGEIWRMGTAQTITWHTTGEGIAYVNIYFSTDGGKSFYTVAEKETNDGTYSWVVPQMLSNTALVRVFAVGAKGENLDYGDSGLIMITAQ
ncbi:MAG: hypothetical protein FJ005_09060 [Chloroflexi bacterium]|nr:hypothetical protein [Chloroflexota bacterium]